MKVLVLGSGVIGVSTAWFLAERGHEVVVVDRAAGPARETSFANGGQLSVGQSEPWAQPGAPWQVIKWLFRDDAPLLFRPQWDPAQWSWIARFLRECLPGRSERNMRQMVALGLHSRRCLHDLRERLALNYHQLSRGILTLCWTEAEYHHASRMAGYFKALGVRKHWMDTGEAIALEPALQPLHAQLQGAAYCPDDESGDVQAFTQALAERATAQGVTFRFGVRINALSASDGVIDHVSITRPDGAYDEYRADAYVLALGSYSPILAASLGLKLPVYPAKGYSLTAPIIGMAPYVSLTDEAHKIVISRLGDRLRVAGTAELSGYATHLNPIRCQALLRRAQTLFPDACDWQAARFWSGLRPATPGNVPLIGRTRYANLYLNTGHGTLGWTEGVGSGHLLAALMDGERPDIGFSWLDGVESPKF